MKIEILGMGCARCSSLEQQVRQALRELNIEAEVTKVSDLEKISSYGVLMTPGLVIDGEVCFSGKVPTKERIIVLLKEHSSTNVD